VKLLQDRDLTPQQRAAGALRLAEKRIFNEVMAAVRRRLAPIRGIPTKAGMESANSDLLEIFDTLENLNKKPAQILRDMLGWDENNQPKPPKAGGCS
jgi:protein-histidine N-methyltransferase